jgi:nucleotide-binding universal stress UspA family protein
MDGRTRPPAKASQEEVFEEFAREFIERHQAAPPARPIDRILVATDFSLCSLGALEYADRLARKLDAELLVLHAEGIPVTGPESADDLHAAAEHELARTVRYLHGTGLRARSVLRPGPPVEEILHAAATEEASLIVMGTHGRRGVAHLVMGSVAERVVRSAPCPVLTVGLRAP